MDVFWFLVGEFKRFLIQALELSFRWTTVLVQKCSVRSFLPGWCVTKYSDVWGEIRNRFARCVKSHLIIKPNDAIMTFVIYLRRLNVDAEQRCSGRRWWTRMYGRKGRTLRIGRITQVSFYLIVIKHPKKYICHGGHKYWKINVFKESAPPSSSFYDHIQQRQLCWRTSMEFEFGAFVGGEAFSGMMKFKQLTWWRFTSNNSQLL